MKCPKCGYHSFEHLDSCRKCGQGLSEHKEKFKLRGFATVGDAAPATTQAAIDDESMTALDTADNEPIDFGFDFLDEEEDQSSETPESTPLGSGNRELSLDQPFSVDSEIIPGDVPPKDSNKSEKGPEFAF